MEKSCATITYRRPVCRWSDTIELYVNDEMSDILSAGTLKSENLPQRRQHRPSKRGCLALAVYRDGALETIVTDEKALSGTTEFETEDQLEKYGRHPGKSVFLERHWRAEALGGQPGVY